MDSLSVGLSRVAQLAHHAAESQMKVEISVGTPSGTARGGRDADWTPAQQPDRRRPRITGKTAFDELETPVQVVRTRTRRACQHDVYQLGSEPGNRNSEQRADEGSAMLTVAIATVRTLAPTQETRGYAKISGCMLLSRVHASESQFNESGALKNWCTGRESQGGAIESWRPPPNGGCGSLGKWELWSPGLVSQISWTRVSCCQRGQPSSDGCCCETEQVFGLRDIDHRSRTHISI